VGGLRQMTTVQLERLPRMADFARWGEAVGRGLGWPHGAFLNAYEQNSTSANAVALESSPVALAVRELASAEGSWSGSATELLAALTAVAGATATSDKHWPRAANALSNKLKVAAPALRKVGVSIEFDRTNRERKIGITRTAPDPERHSSR